MTSRTIDYPVFDSDNHLYETEDAFTRYLPEEYKKRHPVRAGQRPHQDRRQRPDHRVHPQSRPSRSWPARALRRSTTERQSRGEESLREIFGEPMKCPDWARTAEARLPAPRSSWASTASLMFPTLASLLEETHARRSRPLPRRRALAQPVAARRVVVQLREPHLHHAGHRPAHRREGDRGARVVPRPGARAVLIRPAPAWGLRGPRLAGAARVRSALGPDPGGRGLVGHALVRLGLRRPRPRSGRARARCCRSSPTRSVAWSCPTGRSPT